MILAPRRTALALALASLGCAAPPDAALRPAPDAARADAALDAPGVDRAAPLDVVAPDAPRADAGSPDARLADAGDVALADVQLPPPPAPRTGCHCRATPGLAGRVDPRALWLLGAAVLGRRRGRRLPAP